MADSLPSRAPVRRPLADTTRRVNNSSNQSHFDTGKNSMYAPNRAPYQQHRSASSSAATHQRMPSASNEPVDPSDVKRQSQFSNTSTDASSIRQKKTHVGPWQLGKTLGKGSSARVRLTRHCITQQIAAVKIVPKKMAQLAQVGSLAALDQYDSSLPDTIEGEKRIPLAIEREVAILKLIEHPNIMKLYDIWENRSEIYLVLEYVDRGDLFEFINARGRIPEDEAMYYFRQIISAVDYCHSFNICHRDLKPENILLTSNGRIKIADFGMAALHQSPQHQLHTACGSPHYAAPELLENRKYRGDKTDIWSMGVILFAMLSARLPFDDENVNIMLHKTRMGKYTMPDFLSKYAKDLIRRILSVDPAARISMKGIWEHNLLRKYDYLDDLRANGCQAPGVRRREHFDTFRPAEVDQNILRQMRSMWHTFTEKQLRAQILNGETNDQKLFYWLLYNYRQKQLENFNPNLSYSHSDYHHLKPPVWTRKYSTCEFSQPNANGHARSVSRFTVISNVAETDGGTVQSYDPYRGSRLMHQYNRPASRARIVVHREVEGGGLVRVPTHASRVSMARNISIPRQRRLGSRATAASSQLLSPMGSMNSISSSRPSTFFVRPAARPKRGVDFSRALRRQGDNRKLGHGRGRKGPASIAGDGTTYERDYNPASRPRNSGYHASTHSMMSVFQPRDLPAITSEELEMFSSSIAKDCDEAFNSTFLGQHSPAPSTDLSKCSMVPQALSFSLDTPSPALPPRPSSRPWDLRPLPPPPPMSESVLQEFTQDEGSTVNTTELMGDNVIVHPTHGSGDRRIVSAPVYAHFSKQPNHLPSIAEGPSNDADHFRIVSAPPHGQEQAVDRQEKRGPEYLTRVEKSIRVVDSPSLHSPVKVPLPLNVRKKPGNTLDTSRAAPAQDVRLGPGGNSGQGVGTAPVTPTLIPAQPSLEVKKKKSFWFKRNSKDDAFNTSSFTEGTPYSQESGSTDPYVDSQLTNPPPIPAKKRGFSLSFWKGAKPEAKMSLGGPDDEEESSPEVARMRAPEMQRTNRRRGKEDDPANRQIKTHQNWLAKLFRVKPAMGYMCFTISRRRTRQEIAILFKEWRKYGMKDVQVDKERNLVFARVSTNNYLNIKGVSFAAEIMTVIEHGRRGALSIVRLTQERGAATSFYKVVETMNRVFLSRHLLVTDKRKRKMMIKTLNS